MEVIDGGLNVGGILGEGEDMSAKFPLGSRGGLALGGLDRGWRWWVSSI